MRKNLLTFVICAFVFSFICSCASNTSGLRAKNKGSGCNTRGGEARKNAINSIQYR